MARTVLALGGNAILPKNADIRQEFDAIRETANQLATVFTDEELVVTHGNGPQVGQLMLQQDEHDALPLDVLVAETQAQIGYPLQRELQSNDMSAATVVTQVLVDEDDSAFDNPSKPVGPWYTESEAADQPFETSKVGSGEQAYRRVVPSPAPLQVVEADEITQALANGTIPVCCGGGGVPVVRQDEQLVGVEAVIDKDRASALLADTLDADRLIIVTDVDHAYLNYNTDEQEPLEQVTATELEHHLENGEFGDGSMRPKVAACVSFIRNGGKTAVITTLDQLAAAVAGDAGTRVVAE